jgi:hypothetical protein
LFAGLDRAWSSYYDDLGSADRNSIDLNDGPLGMNLPADEFKGLCNGDDVVDTGRDRKRLDFVPPPGSHSGYDGALGAARDVRVVSRLADTLDDMVDFLLGGLVRHIDDHGWFSF